MKHFLVTASIVLFLFSCKKENNSPFDSAADKNVSFFQRVKAQLKDSLSESDYANIDKNRWFKSNDAQSRGCFVRIGLINKEIATDFILLKTDTLGNIKAGKIVHVDKDNAEENKTKFRGRFAIASLDRIKLTNKAIVNGKFKTFRLELICRKNLLENKHYRIV